MKCPKCGYFGPDSLNTCKKCGKELFAEKAKLGLSSFATRSFRPRPVPQKQAVPPEKISETPISPYSVQEKTSPLFMNDAPEPAFTFSPTEPKTKKQSFPSESFEAKFEEHEKESGGDIKPASFPEITSKDDLLFTTPGEPAQAFTMAPPAMDDFAFPETITNTPPLLGGFPSEEELFSSNKQEQNKINLSQDTLSLDVLQEENKELLTAEKGEKFPGIENSLPDSMLEKTLPGKIKTEPIEDDELAQILQDITHGS